MTKRSFFKSIMGVVACVALAPEIAFGRLRLPTIDNPPMVEQWNVSMWWQNGDQSAATYTGDDGKERFLDQVMTFVRCNEENPLVDYKFTRKMIPYSEFQRLMKEAGLTV